MDDEDETEAHYSLLLPFVAAASNGGPFDDNAFAAGWACGEAWIMLKMLTALDQAEHVMTVREELVTQIDLIAMHFGWSSYVEYGEHDVEGWVTLVLENGPGDGEQNLVAGEDTPD